VADKTATFVVLTSQRTGSTLLIRSLDSSSRIFCAGELFRRGRGIHHLEYQFPFKLLGSVNLGKLCDAFASRFRIRKHLSNFYLAAGVGVEAVGFKLMVSQLRRYPEILSTAVTMGSRLLFLFREDTLAAALSYCRAKASGVFHSDRLHDADMRPSIVVGENEFVRVLRECKLDKQELVRIHRQYGGLLMRYEDMVSNWDELIEKLGIELGLNDLRVAKALSKLRSGVDAVHIANEQALIAKFAGAIPDSDAGDLQQ
jgi:LPS sulfotransferase NodH